jgi:hypothetical protein
MTIARTASSTAMPPGSPLRHPQPAGAAPSSQVPDPSGATTSGGAYAPVALADQANDPAPPAEVPTTTTRVLPFQPGTSNLTVSPAAASRAVTALSCQGVTATTCTVIAVAGVTSTCSSPVAQSGTSST